MSTSQQNLVCDNSTAANFTSWASAMSAFIASIGWVQTNDTGQVMWTGMTISACTSTSGTSVYTYASLTGLALANGRALTITGMTQAGNNGVFVITAFTGTTSGTFTVTNAAGVTESSSSGVVTKITAVPGSGAYVTEWWTPTDGLTSFVVEMQYGNFSGQTNCPSVYISLWDATNGLGVGLGNTTNSHTPGQSFTAPSSSTTYDCRFSGDASRFDFVMWRNAPNAAPQFIGVERSLNSSGTPTGTYVTVCTAGTYSATRYQQSTLVIGVGVPPGVSGYNTSYYGGMPAPLPDSGRSQNCALGGYVGIATASPYIGYFDYPMTICGLAPGFNFQEGQIFTATLYGSTRTYICCGTNPLGGLGPMAYSAWLIARYD